MSKPTKKATGTRRHAETERISLMGREWKAAPFALLLIARDFVEASRAITRPPEGISHAQHYLVCHAIELALKAYLCLKGRPMLELMAHGHHLDRALQDGIKHGLLEAVPSLSAAQLVAIEDISRNYNDKVFEYPALALALVAYQPRPDLDLLQDAAASLVDALHEPCLHAA